MSVLKPSDEGHYEEGLPKVSKSHEHANCTKLGEAPLIGAENTFQEGVSIPWVLLEVVLNVRLQVFGLVAYL